MKILIVEDEINLVTYLKIGLEDQGHVVDFITSGRKALERAETTPYDLLLLDIMLPEMDGLTICRRLRARGEKVPILMLTARDSIDDRVVGLEAGADDYLVKPFAMKELLARIKVLGRRSGTPAPPSPIIHCADLVLDTSTRRAQRAGQVIELTAKEFEVLEYLMRNPDRAITRMMIAEHAWNSGDLNNSNIVDVYIQRLRSKIDAAFPVKLIHTIRGSGYFFSDGSVMEQ